jgi:hypothetical protein
MLLLSVITQASYSPEYITPTQQISIYNSYKITLKQSSNRFNIGFVYVIAI